MHRSTVAVAVLTVACLAVSPVDAQEASDAGRGRFSLSLVPVEDAKIGVWARLLPRATFGLNVGASYEQVEDDQGSDRVRLFSLEPAVKVDLPGTGALVPYVYGGGFIESGEARAQATAGNVTATATRSRRRTGAALGAGLDWFVVPRVSVGGHAGVRGGSTSNALRVDGAGQAPVDEDGAFVSTFSSGVRIHLYF
jgi:hypothetical protein